MKNGRYWALAAASAVVLAFGSAQTTGALWSDEEVVGGGTITSGTLDIAVGPAGAEVNNYVLAALGSSSLGPNGYSQAPLSVRNVGSVPFVYRLQNTTLTGSVPLTLTATVVAAASNCPVLGPPSGAVTQLYAGTAAGAQAPSVPGSRSLAPGVNEVWCFRLATNDNPPQSQTSTVTFSFRADQT